MKTDTVKTPAKPSIEELAKSATPKEIRAWIATLEAAYEEKKRTARDGLKTQVKSMLDLNGYTVEELFGARTLPSTDTLATQWDSRVRENRDRKEKMIESTLG